MYTIKQVADKLKVTENAIRFYEKKGLMQPIRKENNYRMYQIEDISRLQMILLYRKMGFSIEAILELLKRDEKESLLDIFMKQSILLNQQIHILNEIKKSIDTCTDQMLNSNKLDESMTALLEDTASKIATMSDWTDLWNFDSWAENYDTDIRKDGDGIPFYKNYDLVIDETAKAVAKKPGKVLEIGIGTANLTNQMLKKGILKDHIVAIDASRNMLKVAKGKCPDIPMKIGTYLQIPYDPNSIDTVVSSYAFHHNNDQEKVLAVQEMDRVIGEHGRIIITDLMFASRKEREKYENSCTDKIREELQDEYFAYVDELKYILEDKDYQCKTRQIDPIMWIIVGEK
ncbi:SAM-dependent methlytransferase YrrT [Lachnospiraceae bacterium KM106-2]|nr:SAM-dependent methlytransferase YrrT [Lachnospiraceae bacterium KM106-2]